MVTQVGTGSYPDKMAMCYGTSCSDQAHEGFDFCKKHQILFNLKSNNIKITKDKVSYVAPISGRVILDDTWFRTNERFFRGYETKLIPSQGSYTWVFVYHMVKRIEKRIERIKMSMSARKIQVAWRRCISDPSYKTCRTRLVREASEPIF